MDKRYFDIKDTLFDITEKYKEAIDLLVSVGFENIKDENQRKTIGKTITLETALKMKKINIDTFTKQLINIIEDKQNNVDKVSEVNQIAQNADVKIEGILPCPVRVPLMEAFQDWLENNKEKLNVTIGYELKAASMGVDWLKESLEKTKSVDVLPDIFISAGFDLFFDKNLIGKYKSEGVFEDITEIEHYNRDFENDYINLKDPDKQYSMIGVVPAVFLVNTEELKGLKMPSSWEDILSEEFENKVSLPIGDFDLFNAILLNIYKKYGEEGVKKLGKSLLKSMHPSEMVKSHIRKTEKPVVTIMPYFFTRMIKREGPMKAIWPKDGAIISPIFMLSKKEKKEKLKPIVDFFASKKVGEILSHNGKFPSVNPDVDNMISKDHKYMWIGWDYIKNNDIGSLISKCEKIFNETIREV
ncbi:ABC transporter substrate-binding protein [Tepidibacter thalassicus]|uniref:ABC-type Fe3+ transport system, substrate-binding protein n=1 Tax=Tepidibacter thalassicus DSM 15285 TaxID=1123350 RepID=A0A1M5SJU0_9FIRM|nr:ABC transporter substrate-binding protein [Tepidibacter thalassicus]SHH38761.1 ABC-type Fe3+ transport system, substrate-binding protein [Tepidibacter thalassicus DSM 15285]